MSRIERVSQLLTALALVAALHGAGVAPARAQAQEPAVPGSELTIYLLTMGQGDVAYEKFGHNAVWVHDAAQGTDRVYNYGVFDFNSPGYWGRFVRGNWLYELAVFDIYSTLFQYQQHDRSVVAQALNLTPERKRELRDFLEWNARPENRQYPYDYYRDNCSTRIRDAIDRVIGGRLRAATEGVPTGTTYRWHTDRLIAEDRVAYTGLKAGLGPAADREIDAWEEMFIPFELQERLRDVRVTDATGAEVPLVGSEEPLYLAVDRAPARGTPPRWFPWYLLAGLTLGGAFFGLAELSRRGSRAARAVFSGAVGLWGALLGIGGLLLAALWMLTDHSIAHRNENLFLLNPLALGLVVLLPAVAFGGRWARRPAWLLSAVLAGIGLLGLLLKPFPGFHQANAPMIALLLPTHLALAAAAWFWLREGSSEPAPRPRRERRTRAAAR